MEVSGSDFIHAIQNTRLMLTLWVKQHSHDIITELTGKGMSCKWDMHQNFKSAVY